MIGILPVIETIQNQLNRDFCLWDDTAFDILHTNSIEIIDQNIDGFCKKGDWLVSIREIDLIGTIDPETQSFVWTWGPGFLDKQHSPSLLANGNVLIFDNGPNRGFTRVIEFNPLSREFEWQYTSDPPKEFFSPTQGFSQRLPNGNTLITESLEGRAFEVTKEGEIVWAFYTPMIGNDKQIRRTIYRMTRIVNPEMTEQIRKRIGQDYN
jgi:hypothetical protein